MTKWTIFAMGLMMGLMATQAAAHVNWFVDADAERLPNIAWTDPLFLGWIVVACLMVAFSIWIDGKLPNLRIVESKTRHDFMEIMRVFTGMSFLLTAYEGTLVAPHKVADGSFGLALVFLQAICGLMLIANRWLVIASAMILILHVGVVIKFGLLSALEYFMIVGIALFLMLNSFKDPKLQEKWKPYSVDVLRISTGISLVALAFGEKLGATALGQVFVAQYQWNFMEALGLTMFNDSFFVLSAGMVELVLGVVLILGTTVRLAVLALSVMMALSNVVFIIQGNNEAALVEFIGHMPIIGVALLLLLLGYGRRLKVTNLWTKPVDRRAPTRVSPPEQNVAG